MEDHFQKIFELAVRIEKEINVEPKMPRIAGRQIHRDNIPGNHPEQYYLRNFAVPFVSRI